MTYRIDEKLGAIVFDYVNEDGDLGMQVIPMNILASRMAVLDLDDPGLALAALAAEITTDGAEPYAPVVGSLAAVPPVEILVEAPPAQMMGMRSFGARTGPVLETAPSSTLIPPTAEDMAADAAVIAARAGAFATLDMAAGPEPAADSEFKEFIRSEFGDNLQRLKTDFLASLARQQ